MDKEGSGGVIRSGWVMDRRGRREGVECTNWGGVTENIPSTFLNKNRKTDPYIVERNGT